MAGVSPWFRGNLRGQDLRTPEPGYSSKWDVAGGDLAFDPYNSPVYNMLAQQGKMNRGVANRQLGMMGAPARDRSSRRLNAPSKSWSQRQMEQAQARGASAQAKRAETQSERAAQELANMRNVIGMAQRGGGKTFGDYQLMNAMKQYTGGPTGNAGFDGPALNDLGAGNQASAAKMAMAQRQGLIPGYQSPYDQRGGGENRPSWQQSQGESIMGAPSALRGVGRQQAQPGTIGYRPQRLKTGTVPGTVPETGPYELHQNEIVVSADQVDPPLLDALKKDKLSKMHTGQMDGKGTGPGHPATPNPHHPQKGPTTGVTAGEMMKDEFQDGSMRGMGMGVYPAPTGQQGPMFGGDQPSTWDKNWDLVGRFWDEMTGGESDPEESGELMRRFLSEEVAGAASPILEYGKGFLGAGGGEEEAAAPPEAGGIPPEIMGPPSSLMGQGPEQGSIEAALARTSQGDFGTGDSPLTLGAGDLSEEELEQQRSQTKEDIGRRGEDMTAFLDNQKADRMREYALRETWLDPQTRDGMLKEADRISKVHEKRKTERIAVQEGRAKRSQDMTLAERQIKAGNKRMAMEMEAGQQVQQRKQAADLRGMATSALIAAQAEGDDPTMAIHVLAQALQMEARSIGEDISMEEARKQALESVGLSE